MARAHVLRSSIRDYAWGSRTRLARFLGQPEPSPKPQAELWMGAHPAAPSRIELDGRWVRLDAAIRRSPAEMLGAEAVARHGSDLPFLLKVLAADRALSIQAHPDRRQAEAGCRAEDARGIPRDHADRNYRDERHKPEVLYALEPFTILRGFRPPEEVRELLERLDVPRLLPEPVAALDAGDLEAFYTAYMRAGAERLKAVLSTALARIEPTSPAAEDPYSWVLELERQCPGDRGVLAPLFLHLVALQPGEAMFTGPGILHAYLDGLGVELMASSDNVVRGGLTPKHVDVDELLAILRFEAQPPALLGSSESGGERRFDRVADEFQLSVITLDDGVPRVLEGGGVEILLCAAGHGRLVPAGSGPEVSFRGGEALFVPAAVVGYRLEGQGTVFRASLPRGERG